MSLLYYLYWSAWRAAERRETKEHFACFWLRGNGGVRVQVMTTHYTTEGILTALGYPDPLAAARQQARMMLLGHLARYQATVQQFERRWGCTLGEMRVRYSLEGQEDFEGDDDYLDWQWYADAAEAVQSQLTTLAAG